MVAVRIVESILDGDIGTLICALFPFAIATWWIIRVHILSARKWKPPLVSWEGESDGGHRCRRLRRALAPGRMAKRRGSRHREQRNQARRRAWPLSGLRQGWAVGSASCSPSRST